ncbi:MAG: OmpH family outer membrane protein [Candidatus Zipacnadales bacterium]
MRHLVVWVVTALLIGAVPYAVFGQEASPKIGVVDLELVGVRFEKKVKAEEELTAWFREQQGFLRELSRYIFATATEWEEIENLVVIPKANRKPEQDTRLTALLDDCTAREREFRDLEAKADRTKEENERYEFLLEIAQTRDKRVNERAEALQKDLEGRMQALREELMQPVQGTINAIAAERGFVLVLEKDYVYFGGEDVTEEVIKRLNEGTAPGGGAADESGKGGQPKKGGGDKSTEGGGNP